MFRVPYRMRRPLHRVLITLAARGLEEHNMQITLIFARIIIFLLFTVLLLLMYKSKTTSGTDLKIRPLLGPQGL